MKTTRLPILKGEICSGLVASEFTPQDIYDDLLFTNPVVAEYIGKIAMSRGENAARCCLLLYKMLDTQAECDELNDS